MMGFLSSAFARLTVVALLVAACAVPVVLVGLGAWNFEIVRWGISMWAYASGAAIVFIIGATACEALR